MNFKNKNFLKIKLETIDSFILIKMIKHAPIQIHNLFEY